MSRVLNFSEFYDKYSNDSEPTINDFQTASDNFSDAFDKESYDTNQLGPNRPVSGGDESTPAEATNFTQTQSSDMFAPSMDQETEESQEDNTDTPDDLPEPVEGNPEIEEAPEKEATKTANPEEGEDSEEEDESEEEEKESVNEWLMMDFKTFINEKREDTEIIKCDACLGSGINEDGEECHTCTK
jgi:hypothetical protein